MLEATFPSKKKIPAAVIGATSMIGSRFCELTRNEFDLIEADLGGMIPVDITNRDSIDNFFGSHNFEWLILFSAFTDVDAAELQKNDKNSSSWQINVEGTKNVAQSCKIRNKKLVYLSTDFVFDGKNGPYREEDKPARNSKEISWYGWTKLKGEHKVIDSGCQFLIGRTSYPYRAKFNTKTDFVRNILERLQNNTLYPMYIDQFLTPTFIDDIVMALQQLIRSGQFGIYNLVDDTTLSAYEAACEIAETFDFDPKKIEKESTVKFQSENPQATKRPIKGGLKNTKLQAFLASYNLSMLNFSQALLEMKRQIEGKR